MIFTGGLEAQPGPGRAFGVAGQPAGFTGRAKPAPGPREELPVRKTAWKFPHAANKFPPSLLS